jgi:hypothetical protein
MLFRSDLLTAHEIGFTDDPDHFSSGINHGKRADVVLDKQLYGVGNQIIRFCRDHVADHDVHRVHSNLLSGAHVTTLTLACRKDMARRLPARSPSTSEHVHQQNE